MDSDYERFFELLNEGHRLSNIEISITKINGHKEEAKLTLISKEHSVSINTTENKLLNYVNRLHAIPHIDDDDADFMYIENPTKYFDIQKKVTEIVSEKISNLKIHEKKSNIPDHVIDRIRLYEQEWIDSEKNLRIQGTNISRIFFDVAIINFDQNDEYFNILDKTKLTTQDINALLDSGNKFDYSIAVSAFFLSRRFPVTTDESSDVIIGFIEYDIKRKEILSFNINTINQFLRTGISFPRYGLWEYANLIFSRIKNDQYFTSLLPLPVFVKDYTCLPWICYCFLQQLPPFNLENCEGFELPLLMVFGIPPIFLRRPGYIFDQNSQKVIIMLGLNKDANTVVFHQVRFDVSKGEPNLHYHYEIMEKDEINKIMNHIIINFQDILSFNENLGIGFLLASVYDVTFDRVIIPEKFEGIFDVYNENPMMVFPLYARSMVGAQCRTLLSDRKLKEVFSNALANPQNVEKNESIMTLEEMGLLKDGKLTILGNIANVRIAQMER